MTLDPREFDEDGRALCFQCGEPQSAHPDGEECVGREYARGFAAGRAAATPDPPTNVKRWMAPTPCDRTCTQPVCPDEVEVVFASEFDRLAAACCC